MSVLDISKEITIVLYLFSISPLFSVYYSEYLISISNLVNYTYACFFPLIDPTS
jgi:hypothetical protein